MGFFERFFRRLKKKDQIHPRPAGWNRTISDLMAEMKEGKRASVGQPEIDWARDYERSLIPQGMRFPRKGDLYEALEDMKVDFLTAWSAPFTGGGTGLLRKGERVYLDSEPSDPKSIGSYAVAIDYEALEERIVPASDRTAERYNGFYFYFKTVDLNQKFRLVETDYEKKG
jgi:hypothetical protein